MHMDMLLQNYWVMKKLLLIGTKYSFDECLNFYEHFVL